MTIPNIPPLVEVAKAAAEIAHARSDYVYDGQCTYFDGREYDEEGRQVNDSADLQPSCLFGHAFAKLGISPDQVEEDVTVDAVLQYLYGGKVTEENDDLIAAMVETQRLQDTGKTTWGEAVKVLDAAL